MEQVIDLIIGSFGTVYNLISKFTLYGVSLFDFLVALLVIGVMLPIVVNIARTGLSQSSTYAKNEIRYAERKMNSKGDVQRYKYGG